jgi:hypothetical protein
VIPQLDLRAHAGNVAVKQVGRFRMRRLIISLALSAVAMAAMVVPALADGIVSGG